MSWHGLLDFREIKGGMISGLEDHEIQQLIDNCDLDEKFDDIQCQPSTGMQPTKKPRFGDALTTKQLDEKLSENVPQNTIKRNKWATTTFKKWYCNRIPVDDQDEALRIMLRDGNDFDITTLSIEQLNHWLSKFLFEIRKVDGSLYPQCSLVSIIAGLQSHLKLKGKCYNFFTDTMFSKITSGAIHTLAPKMKLYLCLCFVVWVKTLHF